jgi:hypothetical protein
LRQWLHEHQTVAGVASLLVIVGGLWWLFAGRHRGAPPPENAAWYFDVVEQRPFLAEAKQIPPIDSPWGHPAVRVFYFSCGACTETERFAGFYMRFTDEAKRRLDADPQQWPAALGESYDGRMYSADGRTWVEAPDVASSGVNKALADKCPGKLRVCR